MSQPQQDKKQFRILGAVFRDSISFGGQSQSVQVGRNCDKLYPARLEADGLPVAIDKGQRADGLCVGRSVSGRTTSLAFVPWANVGEVQYGE